MLWYGVVVAPPRGLLHSIVGTCVRVWGFAGRMAGKAGRIKKIYFLLDHCMTTLILFL